jgi:hypothetical protein
LKGAGSHGEECGGGGDDGASDSKGHVNLRG